MELFTLELTVANHCGVLNRSTGLYAKCKHNIVNLPVYGNGDPALSVMQIASCGDAAVQRLIKTVVLSNNSTL